MTSSSPPAGATIYVDADCPTCGGLWTQPIEVDVAGARKAFARELEEDGMTDKSDEEVARHLIDQGVGEPYVYAGEAA